MKLIFMGSSSFCIPILKALLKTNIDIRRVYTQPPKLAGRGKKLFEVPVSSFAKEIGLEVCQPESFLLPSEVENLRAMQPDIILVVAYGLLLPKKVLEVPKLAAINLHASILPKWRGAAPIQRSIIAGDKYSGLSIMKMEEQLDSGPIYEVLKEKILHNDTYSSLSNRLSELGSEFLINFLKTVEISAPRAQDVTGVTYAGKILKCETKINWYEPAQKIDCKIRGLSERPGAWTNINGERIKILSSALVEGTKKREAISPGTVTHIGDAGIEVVCGTGKILIERLQRPGKIPLHSSDFLRGFRIHPNQIL